MGRAQDVKFQSPGRVIERGSKRYIHNHAEKEHNQVPGRRVDADTPRRKHIEMKRIEIRKKERGPRAGGHGGQWRTGTDGDEMGCGPTS